MDCAIIDKLYTVWNLWTKGLVLVIRVWKESIKCVAGFWDWQEPVRENHGYGYREFGPSEGLPRKGKFCFIHLLSVEVKSGQLDYYVKVQDICLNI